MDRMKLLVSIVERGHGVAMQRLYGKYQLFLHLQCAGRGTATSEIMDILGLGSTEKDVVLTFASQAPAAALLHDLDNDLRGGVGTSGIVFSLPLSALNGMSAALIDFKAEEWKHGNGGTTMEPTTENTLILAVCRRGHTDAVMATAKAHGARGGTVIKGRLSGSEDLEQAYGLDPDPRAGGGGHRGPPGQARPHYGRGERRPRPAAGGPDHPVRPAHRPHCQTGLNPQCLFPLHPRPPLS